MVLLRSREFEHKQIELAIAVLERAVINHTKWLQCVHESIICGEPADKDIIAQNAHQNCKLGQWYYTQTAEIFSHFTEFVDLEEPHRLMHDAARELLKRKDLHKLNIDDYRLFINKQQLVIQKLLKLKDKLVGSFHSFDSLTGAINRDAFYYILEQEQTRSVRERSPCCLAMIDIDHFKKINDTHGHVAGDHALHDLAQLIKKRIRKSDTLCRFGGEEFILLFPDTDESKGFALVEEIRKEVAETMFEISDNLTVQLSFSGGVAACNPNGEIEDIIEVIDRKLYRAKESGRNKIIA